MVRRLITKKGLSKLAAFCHLKFHVAVTLPVPFEISRCVGLPTVTSRRWLAPCLACIARHSRTRLTNASPTHNKH